MKSLILLEMLALYAGDLVLDYDRARGADSFDATIEAIKRSWRHLIAVVILLALLLAMANAGFGGAAALFGAVVSLAWWIATSGNLAPRIAAAERSLFA